MPVLEARITVKISLSPEAAYLNHKGFYNLLGNLPLAHACVRLYALGPLRLFYETTCGLSVLISCNILYREGITYLGIVRSGGGA